MIRLIIRVFQAMEARQPQRPWWEYPWGDVMNIIRRVQLRNTYWLEVIGLLIGFATMFAAVCNPWYSATAPQQKDWHRTAPRECPLSQSPLEDRASPARATAPGLRGPQSWPMRRRCAPMSRCRRTRRFEVPVRNAHSEGWR